MFESFSIIFLISALLSYVNYRWLKLPSTIGTMILALLVGGVLIVSENVLPEVYEYVCDLILEIDFKALLLDIMLSMLLFAGAIHVDIKDLKKEKWSILLFATVGVLLSTALVGFLIFLIAPIFGVILPLIFCLLFGALISPTDPIAVIAILKEAKVGKSLELKIEGESLFNDGIGVVVFTSLLLLAGMTEGDFSDLSGQIAEIFLREAIGGILFGFLLGWIALSAIRSVQENAQLVVILTLATVLGGYALAHELGTSGPLAMVVTGLLIGDGLNHKVFNQRSREMANEIWEVLDESLNSMLFVLIGLSIHLIKFESNIVVLGIVVILVVLISRAISVVVPYSILSLKNHDFWKTSTVLTWGGLRGGISLALAMSLPEDYYRSELLLLCFLVVVFSILVQGLSLGKVVKRIYESNGLNSR